MPCVRHWNETPLFWRVNLLGWAVFAIVAFGITWLIHLDFPRATAITLLVVTFVVGLSFALGRFYLHLSSEFNVTSAAIVSLSTLACAVILATIWHFFIELTGWESRHFSDFENWLLRILTLWVIFLGWSFAYFWLESRNEVADRQREAEQAQREAHRMELQLLRAQLDPHFLFNSLNGVIAEIKPHPDRAIAMTRELSDYLRYSLNHRKTVTGQLSAELDAMRGYLAVEQARFGDRLQVDIEVEESAADRQVPTFLLQPLVENAVKHGFATTDGEIRIGIRAAVASDILRIEVTNSGRLDEEAAPETGIGLETLRRRMALHFPGRHSFDIYEQPDGVHAVLELFGEPCCV